MLSHFSHAQLFVTPWTVARQAPLSMEFSRHEYGGELPCPPPGDLPDSGIEPVSLKSPALTGGFFTNSATWEALSVCVCAPVSSMLMSSTDVPYETVLNSYDNPIGQCGTQFHFRDEAGETQREVQQLFQGHRAEVGFPPAPLSPGGFPRLPVQRLVQGHTIPQELYTIAQDLYTIPQELYTITQELYTIPQEQAGTSPLLLARGLSSG